MFLIWNQLKNEIWKGLNRYFQKDAHQKSERGGGSVRSDSKKLDSFTLETSKIYPIRNFLRIGHLRVKWRTYKEQKSFLKIPIKISVPYTLPVLYSNIHFECQTVKIVSSFVKFLALRTESSQIFKYGSSQQNIELS